MSSFRMSHAAVASILSTRSNRLAMPVAGSTQAMASPTERLKSP
jgi:hypothetical protein